VPTEAGEHERVAGQPKRAQHLAQELLPIGHERLHEFPVCGPVTAERLADCIDRALQYDGSAAVEGVGKRGRRINPL
jgi:hypothetical protein